MFRHWIEEVAEEVEKRGKKSLVFNGGLSVSGLQHIGRLRGEVLIGDAVQKILKKKGYDIKLMIVLYTQDAWKGKTPQLNQFRNNEGKKYVGWPLIRVPDPQGCHSNWVEHYWQDFGDYLDYFTHGKVEVVTTTELYKKELKNIVKESIKKRKEIREVINRYRKRNPYPESWIPFEPVCDSCGRIDKTEVLEISNDIVYYKCKNCGYEGETSIENGKLNWRTEWAGVWKALKIDFEPYGKDHATPGGSRDSCKELSLKVFEYDPPYGIPYEWVAIRKEKKEMDMSSSDFIGVTPREWLEVAHPEVLRYLYYSTHPRKKIVIDMSRIPDYYNEYYEAERIFYESKKNGYSNEEEYIKGKSYELSLLDEPAEKLPVQIPYITMSLIVQSLPEKDMINNVIARLKSSSLIKEDLTEKDMKRLNELMRKTRKWVDKYAPQQLRYRVLDEISPKIKNTLSFRELLIELGHKLASLDEWNQEKIKEVMIKLTENMGNDDRKAFYQEFYKVFIGQPRGPRAAALVEALGKEFVKKRLIEDLG